MSTLKLDTILAADGTQTTEPSIPALDQRMAKAWVNFNGTGTVAIRDSYNVSSITDNGTGDYSINFATAMANVNYTASGISNSWGSVQVRGASSSYYTTTSLRLGTWISSTNLGDTFFVNVIVMGGQA
jgi:hypothetical protein